MLYLDLVPDTANAPPPPPPPPKEGGENQFSTCGPDGRDGEMSLFFIVPGGGGEMRCFSSPQVLWGDDAFLISRRGEGWVGRDEGEVSSLTMFGIRHNAKL